MNRSEVWRRDFRALPSYLHHRRWLRYGLFPLLFVVVTRWFGAVKHMWGRNCSGGVLERWDYYGTRNLLESALLLLAACCLEYMADYLPLSVFLLYWLCNARAWQLCRIFSVFFCTCGRCTLLASAQVFLRALQNGSYYNDDIDISLWVWAYRRRCTVMVIIKKFRPAWYTVGSITFISSSSTTVKSLVYAQLCENKVALWL